MAFVKPPARNMPPGSEPWAQWVEEQMSSVTKKSVEAYQYAERAAGGVNSALEGNVQNWDEINRVFEVTENSMQLADGAVVWSTLDPELPEDVPINPNVIWYTYDPETREVLRMWQWGYYDDVEGIYVEDWYQAQLGADSIHDEAITSAKVALGAIDWDQIAPDVENTVTTAQETADKAAADLLIEKDRVNAELGPVKGDLAVLKTTTIPALDTRLTAAKITADKAAADLLIEKDRVNAELAPVKSDLSTLKTTTIPALDTRLIAAKTAADKAAADLLIEKDRVNGELTPVKGDLSTLKTTTIPNLQTALTNVEGAAQSADKRSTVSTAAPSATTGFPQNAVWQRINASGAVIGSWRLSGSSWVQMPLDPVVIPNLSAGIITSGVLNTNRLNAQEVAGAVGSFLSVKTGQITWDNAAGNNAFIGNLVGEQAFMERLYANRVVVSGGNLMLDASLARAWTTAGTNATLATPVAGVGYYGDPGFQVGVTGDAPFFYGSTNTSFRPYLIQAPPNGGPVVLTFWAKVDTGTATLDVNAQRWTSAYARTASKMATVTVTAKWTKYEVEITGLATTAFLGFFFKPVAITGTLTLSSFNVTNKVGSVLIEDGAVIADKITASQELSAKVAEFLSVKTGQITWDNAAGNNAFIGSLVGEQAFLERLYANRIVVSPDNMIRDPGFADASINAARSSRSSGAWFVSDNLNDADMPTCFRIQSAGAADQRLLLIDGPYSDSEPYPSMPVSAGTKVRFSCGVRTYAGVIYQIVAYIVRADGTVASNGFSPTFTHATTGRADVSYEWTVPTDAVRAFMVFRVMSTGATGSFLMVGKPKMTPMVGSVLIEDGAVIADKITASQELSAKVAEFLSVKTGQITWDNAAGNNAFIGNLVGNNAFYEQMAANQMIVTPGNLLIDPSFKQKVAWSNSSYVQASGGRFGGGSLLVPAGTVQRGAYTGVTPADMVYNPRVVPGVKYRLSVYFNSAVASTSGDKVMILYRWYKEEGTNSWSGAYVAARASVFSADAWTLLEGETVECPEGATRLAFGLYVQAAHNSQVRFSDPTLVAMVGTVLIENGAVTADKIVANAITARELAVGAITADKAIIANSAIKSAMIADATILSAHIQDLAVTNAKIANTTITNAKILNLDAGKITTGFLDAARIQANSIVTSKLAATAIDGMTITGSTIQTSSSANTGIKIDTANGLRAWAGGNLGVQISPSIKNGMAVRNPVGEMVPLSDAAFGTVSIARSNGLSVAAPQTSGAWSAWTRHSDSLDDCVLTFTAVSTSYIVTWSQSWATSYNSSGDKQTGVQVGLSTGGSGNLISSGNGGQITGLVGYLQERSADVGDRVRSVTMQGPLSTVVGQTYTLRMYFRYNANGPGTHNISVAARTITATPVY